MPNIEKILEDLQRETALNEGYLTGLFWSNPDNYNFFPEEKINTKTFLNPVYGFFFTLGRKSSEKGLKVLDDLSVNAIVKEYGVERQFEEYGRYETIKELISEVKGKEENLDIYYDKVKKYNLIRRLMEYFGDKVVQKNGNYDYQKMTKEQIHTYWSDKINELAIDGDNKYDEHYLLENIDGFLDEIENDPNVGLPFFKSKMMTGITNGWTNSDVYMFGGFSNAGKTSIVFNKVIMSCIENKEKLCVIANEEGIRSFKEKLIVSVMGNVTKNVISRKKFKQGSVTKEDKSKIKEAMQWVKDISEGDSKLITFIFMENYIMSDVEKVIRHYHNRGVENFIIDTHKVSTDSQHNQRWEIFVEDMKTIYKLTRENGGGLNLRMWVNFQLADHAIKYRFLDYEAIGEGKAAKNEASVVFMIRKIWDDEYEGEKNELDCFKWVPNDFGEGYREDHFTIPKGKIVYLLFTPKNRNGENNETGQPVLLLEADFNRNSWKELGWCYVSDDKSRRY